MADGLGSAASAAPTDLDRTTPWVRWWLRAEGIAALGGAIAGWSALGGAWPWFVVLLLAPDLSMVGYLGGSHSGAIAYNVVHNWFIGGLVLGAGLWLSAPVLTFAGLILVGHTGMDRILGYGLKYPTAFEDTHLGRIGRRRA